MLKTHVTFESTATVDTSEQEAADYRAMRETIKFMLATLPVEAFDEQRKPSPSEAYISGFWAFDAKFIPELLQCIVITRNEDMYLQITPM